MRELMFALAVLFAAGAMAQQNYQFPQFLGDGQYEMFLQERFLEEHGKEIAARLSSRQRLVLGVLRNWGADTGTVTAVAVAMSDQNNDMGWLKRANFGAAEANHYIDLIAKADVAALQYVMDKYYLFSSGEGTWGNRWLAKFVAYDLATRGRELWSQLSDAQREQLNRIIEDAVDEGTFRVDMTCGIDYWNSCAEDFGSMNKLASEARRSFPEVVARVGNEQLLRLEEKYYRLEWSTKHGWYGLTIQQSPIDGNWYAMPNNHGYQSAVYAGINFTQIGNALYPYWLAGKPFPKFYRDPEVLANILSVFNWMQTTSTPDGQSFINGCLNVRGEVGPCNDPDVSNAVPRFIPAGRVVRILLGEKAFRPDLYDFLQFDPSWDGGNCWNMGRKLQFGVRNPDWMNLRILAVSPSLTVGWDTQTDAASYDIWGPEGKITSTVKNTYTFENIPAGTFQFGVIVVGSDQRVKSVGFSSVEVPHIIRRRLLPLSGGVKGPTVQP